jgi:hypothetical protein
MQVQSYTGLVPETALQCLQVSGLQEAKIVFRFPNLQIARNFAIEKRLGGSFYINKTDLSFPSSWMLKTL